MSIPNTGLQEQNVVAFVTATLNKFDTDLPNFTKEEALPRLNSLANLVFSQSYSELVVSKLHLRFAYSLTVYAQKFSNVETCNNVINNLNSDPQKSILSNKYPYLFKYNLAIAYFTRFNNKLRADGENILGKDDLDDIIIAKFYTLKIYDHHKSGQYTITQKQLYDTITLLVSILSQLSRWVEAYDLIQREFQNDHEGWNLMIHYLKAKILNDIMDKTCLNYNGLLLLQIKKHCVRGLDLIQDGNQGIVQSLKEIKNEVEAIAEKNNIDFNLLIQHDHKNYYTQDELSATHKELIRLKLYLNEHRFFCSCSKSLSDDLKIETNHLHTKIPYAANKQMILDDVIAEYTLSRMEYFKSEKDWSLSGFGINSFSRRRSFRLGIKSNLLKSAFRRCYSILDTISTSILHDLNDGSDDVYGEDGSKRKIYFLNLWDTGVVGEDDYKRNQSLHALYSISKDLGQDRKSALKNFKKIRNSIEHKSLVITDKKTRLKENRINRSEMQYATDLLLQITKSAIHSFVYYVRRESIFIQKKCGEHCASDNRR